MLVEGKNIRSLHLPDLDEAGDKIMTPKIEGETINRQGKKPSKD